MKKSEKISDRMVLLRKAHGLTQAEWGKLLGISGNYVYLIESGKKQPSSKILEKLDSLETEPADRVNEDFAPYQVKKVWNETDAGMERTLLKCVEMKDWGGVEKLAAELHRRKIDALN
jgi:transcriptional regulator with XRE-family HTH domain